MTTAQQLLCLAPGNPAKFAIRPRELPDPRRGQVRVRLEASSVNPIDTKRASGYGQRLLALKGAGRFPLVLGNDLAGVVEAVGGQDATWKPGDRVYGLIPTGSQGAHASHVLAQSAHLRAAPAHLAPCELAALPYTFTTLWLALKSVGLHQGNARGKAVLVHGASGGLGQLALQVLRLWGARVTAVCSSEHVRTCVALGATTVIDRTRLPLSSLPRCHDVSLNFAHWQDDGELIRRLKPGAMGHATTVHPLLESFDVHGWIQGGWRAYRAWAAMRQHAVATAGPATRYAWVVFRPDAHALDALAQRVRAPAGLRLPIGLTTPLQHGDQAFAHVAQRRAGRAILTLA